MLDLPSISQGREPVTSAIWPRKDYSRVPYRLYHDPSIYQRELERIFGGTTWSFVGLEVEVPKLGDFRASYLGETPIIFNRDENGEIKGFVNRCAHRGAIVQRELTGNAKTHTCIYHQWCFAQDGKLIGVPFRRGVKGQGGFDKNFDMAQHGLQKVRVASVYGVLFATLSDEAEPIEDYLGEKMRNYLKRIFERPVRVLGYHRQRVRGNWKEYAVNPRDNYHASLLHDFFGTYGLDRTSQVGGLTMDPRHRHCVTWGRAEDEAARKKSLETDGEYKKVKIAVIDTGIDPKHRQAAKVKYKDFLNEKPEDKRDNTGHGTISVDLILRMYEEAELYVARVFEESRAGEQKEASLMAKVRSLSIGFLSPFYY